MTVKIGFGAALRALRLSKNLTQEDFSLVSSRTYISSLERGLKNPTLDKVELIAETLQISPLTLIALAYAENADIISATENIEKIKQELKELTL
ncbi:helix-turn-helix domain-containing protein [Methylophaga nitratireducenticrescens]|uniref:helix-turn-helix domain-containing protein n=1 Tax=Methylophaga nitratireducenticrescens TaxID=754476 RepID=UPI000CDC4A5B|nr:helix-turn-helix transcriptional regulator [Methylophaga nitratireducenticrescens]AUZ84765.1 transcriptional regulator [Methylophaga nitratireducenticrescens]